MTKSKLKKEINAYIVEFGYSVEDACQQVNNLYLNKYLNKIFDIQTEILAAK